MIGDDRRHPDEPEPWTARVELDDVTPEVSAPTSRRPRPLGVAEPVTEPTSPHTPVDDVEGVGEELLRELHSLSDLEAFGADGAPVPASSPAPSTGATEFDAMEELSALEAAIHSLDVAHEAPPVHGPAATSEARLREVGPAPAERAATNGGAPTPRPTDVPADAAPHEVQVTPSDAAVPPPPPAPTTPAPPPGTPAAGSGITVAGSNAIDLGNFTARGNKVGRDGRAKRRRFGR